MDISIHHLRCFLTLAEEQHVTWAADRLGLTQPTLSRQLRRLEDTLGYRLLDRSTRHPHLTPEGLRLQAELRTLLPQLEAALQPAAPSGDFRLGYSWGFPLSMGREVIRHMEEEHQILVQPVRSDTRTAGLSEGTVDAALVWNADDDPRLTAITIRREPRVAAISRRSTLAVKPTVTWRDLGRRCIVLNTASGTLTPADWPPSATPEIGAEAANLEEYLHAVAARRGVGVLPASVAAANPDPDILYLSLSGAPPAVLSFVHPRSDPHPHASTLADEFRHLAGGAARHPRRNDQATRSPQPAAAS
ncbi:LysR family transcriptional regulator [Streptomyces sp. NPDC046821]|uniref:LysR family transcriptional regulator n=1 Tax=Streptomyces sp. NPDC046821 TaxID=3154702 RepID=UPI0033DE8A7D